MPQPARVTTRISGRSRTGKTVRELGAEWKEFHRKKLGITD